LIDCAARAAAKIDHARRRRARRNASIACAAGARDEVGSSARPTRCSATLDRELR
jgi:hypothetical protein